jgi:3-oxoacyl-[acyl-carrier protein] reductase
VALVTGVSRAAGIGAAVATALACDGWQVAAAGWRSYDSRKPWGSDLEPMASYEVDLSDQYAPGNLVDRVTAAMGPLTALVLCHAEAVGSTIADTTVHDFDRHLAVNARATWLLVKAFAAQFHGAAGTGRIVAVSSDDAAFHLPYGASKGAQERIVQAAAVELANLGITANVVDPGATDTGWMTPEVESAVRGGNLQPRVGQPGDCANLVRFLCSPEGQWVNGQRLRADGGVRPLGSLVRPAR